MHNKTPRRRSKIKWIEKVFEEIMAGNFPNLKEEIDMLVQLAQRIPNKMNLNRPSWRHIVIKKVKVKEKAVWKKGSMKGILKAVWKK